ncbi:MAG: tetratricopeptide repeat protein [Aquabacterium sp.]|uniref:O-linked N-acetylglucosamine transferase, SPINDLY family protein n=1 Tax=Aquabacterium sp. TaxID=1872578 RepID=UPI0025C0F72C|nr:tetratricopeptide repeat protein [Aquabacterium sp.]MBI5926625.1 tetratricopeptide repeat protein [Aquabacterium sp.]
MKHKRKAPSHIFSKPPVPAQVSTPKVLPQADGGQLIALFNAGRYADLESGARQLSLTYPNSGFVWKVLGTALLMQGRHAEGIGPLQRAVSLMPGDVEAHSNLGNLLRACDRLSEAEASYRQAISLRPDYAAAHFNLGITLRDLGRLNEAVDSYREALRLSPGFAEAHNNLGNALKDLGRLDEALAAYRQAWACKPDYVEACGNVLFARNYLPGSSPDVMLAEARAYGSLVAGMAQPFTSWPNLKDAQRKLRIGLVSGDLIAHPVGFFLEGVMAAIADHESDRLDVLVYANNRHVDDVTQRIRACSAGWCDVSDMSDQVLAQRIRSDAIDILVDLSGHTGLNRLPMFAWKPAPVQVSWLGYVATTGVGAIDWLLADPWTLPTSEDAHFTEQIWRLPETRMCFTAPQVDAAISPLPAERQGHVTFGCFNNLTKVNDDVIKVWARVLQAVPGSQLILKADQLADAAECQRMHARFAVHGLDPQRVQLQGRSPRADYLSAYQQIDIALDPFPYTGGTTSAESLWMGVPVLTLAGERMIARQGVGLMVNAGLPDWVASDQDDYVAKAVAHAGDITALAALRARLRAQVMASPLFDAARFAAHLQVALRGMWLRWVQS